MAIDLFPSFIKNNYEIYEWKHATTILQGDFKSEWDDLLAVLTEFRIKKSWISIGGGRKSKVAEWLDSYLGKKGWIEKGFDTRVIVDNVENVSPTHKVDCYKNKIALEIEWNNKDPFFDRDLNNFRLLFELRAISVGIIVTRCDELQNIFDEIGRGSSFGASTTHMGKLLPRILGGSGGGCPLLAIGIKSSLIEEDI
jgi:hypothetical protein